MVAAMRPRWRTAQWMVDWIRTAPSFCGCWLLVEVLLHDAATFAADEDERPPRATAEQALEIS